MRASRAELPLSLGDKYAVDRVIGRGGMGTVFEARHARLGHRVAIKMLGEELRAYPELVTRFDREARAAGALSSPHAVRVFDIDQTEDGTPFIVMELLSGRDLGQLVERNGAQPISVAIRWLIEACDAIAEAHRLGIIHRDIKPANLLLCDSGRIKVLDFGIAKRIAANEAPLTLGVAPLGTPQYMSPEQVRGAKDVDGRSDIWSLGVTLYELVCGRPPFDHDSAAACIASIVVDPIPDPRAYRPELPEEVARIILRALEKDPGDRFQSVDELIAALAPFAERTPRDNTSWRVVASASRAGPGELTTLDGDKLVLDLASRKAKASAPRRRRGRSPLALAFAAAFGIVALFEPPKCVSTRLAAAWMSPPASAETSALKLSVPVPADEGAALRSDEAAPANVATSSGAAMVRSEREPSTGKAPSGRPLAVRGSARVFIVERPAHGGISNPGF